MKQPGSKSISSALPSFPEDADCLQDLIAAEYQLRRRREPNVTVDEFLKRFPEQGDILPTRLTKGSLRRLAARLPLRLNCPHCQNPIEVVADESADDVLCPSCGSTIRMDRDLTYSWQPERLPRLGRFELKMAVGRGAFGTVYRALDKELDRAVAVKLPRSGQFAGQEDEDRFIREARSVAQLNHPGIVPVFEVGRSDEFPYVVSEFVDGITLADELTARRYGFREAAELVVQVAEALAHAHEQGVVHRDLKPSNIMLTFDGKARLMDFGLAKREAGEVSMTLEGQVLGTPAYMPPEQAAGEARHVDGRSDIYSLGVILYELICGELPFRGASRMLMNQVMHDEPRAPRSLNDRIPRDLETICLKAMAKEPHRRYPTAGELADDLKRYLAGQPIHARPVGRIERVWRWGRRRPALAGLSVAVVLALLVGTAVSTFFAIAADRNARFAMLSESVAREMAHEAERSREAALRALEGEQMARHQAQINLDEVQLQRQKAEDNLAEAERQQANAEKNFRLAQGAVESYLTEISESVLLENPSLEPLRQRLLDSALAYYEQFIGERGNDHELQAELAAAYFRVSQVKHARRQEWLRDFKSGVDLIAQLVADGADADDLQPIAKGNLHGAADYVSAAV